MKVADLQKYLSDFNPDANVEVVVGNYPRPFNLGYGSAEGCIKRTADHVSFIVDSKSERKNHDRTADQDVG